MLEGYAFRDDRVRSDQEERFEQSSLASIQVTGLEGYMATSLAQPLLAEQRPLRTALECHDVLS